MPRRERITVKRRQQCNSGGGLGEETDPAGLGRAQEGGLGGTPKKGGCRGSPPD